MASVDYEQHPLQQQKRQTGEDLNYPNGEPVKIHCVQCSIEIKEGTWCKSCLRL